MEHENDILGKHLEECRACAAEKATKLTIQVSRAFLEVTGKTASGYMHIRRCYGEKKAKAWLAKPSIRRG
jgi:hypothetical protein